MADKTLVQGAALIGQSMQAPDIVGAVKKGFETGLAPLEEYNKQKEIQKKKDRAYQIDKSKKVGAFGDDYSPNAFEGANLAILNRSLGESRKKYSAALDIQKNLEPGSDEYIDNLTNQTNIKAGFENTLADAKEFSELGKEYITAFKERNLSSGMKPEDIKLFDKIWIDKDYTIQRDPQTGNLNYIVDGVVIPKEKLDDWRIPNQDYANKFIKNYNQKAYSLGLNKNTKLEKGSQDYHVIESDIRKDLKGQTVEELRSLYLDNTVDNRPLLPIKPANLFELSAEELEEITVKGLLNNAVQTNLSGLKKYKAPEKKINLSEADKRKQDIFKLYKNAEGSINPIVNSFFNSDKTVTDATNNFQRLGLSMVGVTKDEEGTTIGYEVKHPLVGRNTFIPINNTETTARALQNALGLADLGYVDTFEPGITEVNTGDLSPTSGSNEPTPIPGLISEEEYPEDFTNLSTEPSTANEQRKEKTFSALNKIGIPKYKANRYLGQIRKEVETYYGGEFSDLNINKAVFDLFGREKYNEKVVKDYNEGESQNKALEEIQKKSTEPFTKTQLKSIDGIQEIGTALNKKGVELTPQDLEIFKYMKKSGKSLEEVKAILTESDLPITE